MTRYGLCLGDFFHGEDILRERISAALVPPKLSSILAETKTTVASALERLESELSSFDPTLNAAAQKSQRKMVYQLSKIGRKVAHQMLRRDEKAARDTQFLYGLIYPRKHLQERLYSIIPLIAKHGFQLIDQIYENVHLECPDHQLLVV